MNNKGYLVSGYDQNKRLISVAIDGEIKYYLFTKSLNNIYHTHIKKGDVYLSFECSNKVKQIGNIEATQISSINSITVFDGDQEIITYSDDSIRGEIKDLINELEYKMFIDFEFTMPAFGSKAQFTPEIIQVGAVITNPDDDIVNEYSEYVKPKKKITDRTISFLRLTEDEINEQVKQKEFYNHLKTFNDIYNPVCITWGGSDSKALSSFYKINKFEPLNTKFVDLSKLIKKYYRLSNDLSLFHALLIFKDIDASQAHHALTDAAVTKEVFNAFKEALNNNIEIDIKAKLEELKNKKEEC